MKKFLVLFLIFCLTAGFAAADEEDGGGLGLSLTMEGGAYNPTSVNGWEITPFLCTALGYEKSFLDDALSLEAELGYEVNFVDEYPMELSFDLSLGYRVGLGSGNLSFLLADENAIDLSAEEDQFSGIVRPGIKYSFRPDIGSLSFQADVPISYLETLIGLDLTAGWYSSFGLGLGVSGYMLFNSEIDDHDGFTGLSFTAFYAFEPIPLFVALEVMVPLKEMSSGHIPYSFFDTIPNSGIKIAPYVSYDVNDRFKIYGYGSFDHIGVDESEIGIVFGLGVTYSF